MTTNRAKTILVLAVVLLALLYGFAIANHFMHHQNTSSKTQGTFSLPGGAIYASQASNNVGQLKTVQFHVGYTYSDAEGTEFLDQYTNYQNGFVVTIYSSDVGQFPIDPALNYDNQTIDVTGVISIYDNYVEILNPSKIILAP
jgi:hypothetical protein